MSTASANGCARKRLIYVVSRAICGETLNGEVDRLDDDERDVVKAALELPVEKRRGHFDRWLAEQGHEDAEVMRRELLASDPRGADPDAVATAADLEGLLGAIEWAWHKWLAKGFVNLLVAEQKAERACLLSGALCVRSCWATPGLTEHCRNTTPSARCFGSRPKRAIKCCWSESSGPAYRNRESSFRR